MCSIPVGAVVLELLPYNWEWKGISQVYHNVTTTVGDIHHFAWRAKHPRWAQYVDENEARYAHWTAEECSSRSVSGCYMLVQVGPLQAIFYTQHEVLLHEHVFCVRPHDVTHAHAAFGALHSSIFQTRQTCFDM